MPKITCRVAKYLLANITTTDAIVIVPVYNVRLPFYRDASIYDLPAYIATSWNVELLCLIIPEIGGPAKAPES